VQWEMKNVEVPIAGASNAVYNKTGRVYNHPIEHEQLSKLLQEKKG